MEKNIHWDNLKKTIEMLKNIHQINAQNPVLAQYEKGFLDALTTIEMAMYTIETQNIMADSISQFWSLFKFPDFNFGQDGSDDKEGKDK